MNPKDKQTRIFYGWYIVGACVLITLYTGGVVHFGFTAVFEPIAEEFGWTYAQVSLASSLRGLEMGLLAPFTGFLVDRYGPRRLIFLGSLITFAGFVLLSRTDSLLTFYISFGLLAIGMSTTGGTVLMTAIANWFHRRAGIAMGIVASGFGLGGLLVPIVTVLVDTLEWRPAMIVVGIGILVIVLPLSFVVRHKPEPYGYEPDGEKINFDNDIDAQNSKPVDETNITIKQAVRSRTFWQLGLSSMCHAFVVGAVVTHLMPYLSSVDIGRTTSSLVAFILPSASIIGRLSSGWLAVRYGSRGVFSAGFVLMTAGVLIFAFVSNQILWLIIPFVMTFSIGWGLSVTSRLSLMRESFGRSNFGKIMGFIAGMMMVGHVTGAPLAGWVYDTWDGYQSAWLVYSAVTILAAFLVYTLPSSFVSKD
ncbi:MAG: MFS transporter [Dehalococcoidia bacterium]|jgi:MFS family permease